MKQSFYLYKSGRIQRKDNTIEVVYADGTKRSIPIERVDDIYVMTEFDFNTNFLNFISQYRHSNTLFQLLWLLYWFVLS